MQANFEAISGKVDANGIIAGVSVATIGEAKGHGLWLDETSLALFQSLSAEHPNGVKVKSKHGSNFDAIVGALKNFRREGVKLLADLHLIKAHPQYNHIAELSEKLPNEFGLSASFNYQPEEIGGKKFVRPTELSSVDLVDEPAANPTGLFSKVDTNQSTDMEDKNFLETVKGFFSKAEKGLVPVEQLSAVQTEATKYKAELETATASLQTVSTKNGELSAQLEAKSKEIESLKATHKAELEAKEADVEKRASAKALELSQKQGVPPGTVKPDASNKGAGSVTRAEFSVMKPADQMTFVKGGGKITD